MSGNWLVVVDRQDLGALGRLVPRGPVTALVIGDRDLAESVAGSGVDSVHWIEPAKDAPAEAYAADAATVILAAVPQLIAATPIAPAARAILGAVSVGCRASLICNVTAIGDIGEHVEVESAAAGGAVIATFELATPLCVLLIPEDELPLAGPQVEVLPHPEAKPALIRLVNQQLSQSTGLADAARVVAVGRGLRSRADLDIVQELVDQLGAEIACSMPVSEDLGWLPRDRFIGRSGQQISPRLYLTVGLSGAPQHLQGVRGAKVVVAINSDPEAGIFRAADYGIVGDLYEIVPALTEALAAI